MTNEHPMMSNDIFIWARSRNCGCLVTWFCYQLITKPSNKTATVPWPGPYYVRCLSLFWCSGWNIPDEKLNQYYEHWCPGSACHQVISSHGTDYVRETSPCLPWERNSTTCAMKVLRILEKVKLSEKIISTHSIYKNINMKIYIYVCIVYIYIYHTYMFTTES